MAEIEKMNLESEDLVEERLAQLKELMPEVFTESGIDFDKLRLELGDEVDEGQERYAFTWPGKMDAIRQSQVSGIATLRPCVEKSRGRNGEDGSFDSDNIYIEGDNLEVLRLLQSGYHGKVKMIYIDPPYNTGKDFVYKDKFGDTIENYKKQTGLAGQSNADTSGRYHSDWCSMMYPRLRLARELLRNDGVIFISIDNHEEKNLRFLCDEIFGEDNYVASLPRVTKKSGKDHSATIALNHDCVFVYARDASALQLNGFEVEDDSYIAADDYVGERGPYKLNQTLDYDSLWYNPTMDFPIDVDGETYYPGGAKQGHDDRHVGKHAPKDWVWRWSLAKFKFGYEHGFVEIKKGRDRKRIYTKTYRNATINKDSKGNYFVDTIDRSTKMSSLELVNNSYSNDNAKKDLDKINLGSAFDFPKPVSLLSKCLELVKLNEDDIVMDFFSGSATTAAAAMGYACKNSVQLRAILVQLPEPNDAFGSLCEIGEERIRRTGDKIKAEIEDANVQLKLGEEPKRLPDIGFRVFSLDHSGIEKPESGQLVLDVVKPDRSDMDIVFEMMLKWGLELTLPVEKEEVAGYPVYSVACGELICCLAPGLTMEALDAIADMEPRRVLMRDSILTDTLKLNAVQAFRRVEERAGYETQLRTV